MTSHVAHARASDIVARAPGKLVIAGEYAVTRGRVGLVAATDRCAIARAQPATATTMGTASVIDDAFFRAAVDVLSDAFGPTSVAVAAARATQIDTSALYHAAQKLGLGSSAATTTALIARAYASQMPTAIANSTTLRAGVYPLAMRAHAQAQAARGAAGSGIDIAAACMGGFVQFSAGQATTVPAPPVAWLAFHTGMAASTTALLAAVAAAERVAPGPVAGAIEELGDIAERVIESCYAQDAIAFILGIANGHRAMHRLAQATGMALVPPLVDRVSELVAPLGGAAKTSGAGGGDVALVAVPAPHRAAMEEALRQHGVAVLPLSLGSPGATIATT